MGWPKHNKTCIEPGCLGAFYAKNLCEIHYRRQAMKRRRSNNAKGPDAGNRLFPRTGWTVPQREAALHAQQNTCAMPYCGKPIDLDNTNKTSPTLAASDHFEVNEDGARTHQRARNSRKVPRGLLCKGCNIHLGAFERMLALGALEYLALYNTPKMSPETVKNYSSLPFAKAAVTFRRRKIP